MFGLITIIQNTYREAIRQPVYLIILFCGMLVVLVSPYYTLFALLENNRLIKDMGMATLLVTGVLVSSFTAASVVYKEIENRTLLTVISKPISRPIFLLGKFIGVFIAILVVEYLLGSMLLHVVRTEVTEAGYSKTDYPVLLGYSFAILFSFVLGGYSNFFYNKPFTSSVNNSFLFTFTIFFVILCFVKNDWSLQHFSEDLDTQLIIAILLVVMATALLCMVAIAASTRVGAASTFTICFSFFLLGLFSDYLFGQYIHLSLWKKVMYYIIPNLQMYWVMDAILEEKTISISYLVSVSGYTLFFLISLLGLAMVLFQEKEAG